MKETIKALLFIIFIVVFVLTWLMMTLEHFTGELSFKTIVVFIFGIFVGILLALFGEKWRKSGETIARARAEAIEVEEKNEANEAEKRGDLVLTIPLLHGEYFLNDEVVVTRGLGKSLFVYSENQWEELVDGLKKFDFGESQQRDFKNFVNPMIKEAVKIKITGDGRITIPSSLKTYAKIKTEKDVIFVNIDDRLEIWSLGIWERKGSEKHKNKILKK